MSSPEGGPKDITPPTVTEFIPPNNSTHFKGKTIRIDFDEFINAETTGDKILISPPVSEMPDFRVRGKMLVVAFADTLRSNTTYSIDFGRAISDITEGNKITGLRYAFSTGSTLDSMSLAGKVTDAFTTVPVKDALVMLYKPDNDTVPPDSLPILVRPFYLTRTGEDGSFMFSNLAPGHYKVFSLMDKTGDMLYNVAGEQIAFRDSLVSPWYVKPAVPDTAARDSAAIRKDTLNLHADTLLPVKLRMFTPLDSIQSLDKSVLLRDRMANFIFRYPVRGLRIVPLNADSLSHWNVSEPGKYGDTVTMWFLGSLPDTLHLKISAEQMKDDTVELPIKFAEQGRKGRKAEEAKPRPLLIDANTRGGIFNFYKGPFQLITNYPLASYDLSAIRIIDGKDTLMPKATVMDSVHRKIMLLHKWAEGRPYQIFVPDSAFVSENGLSNDTLRIHFKSAEARNYGNLKITLNVPEGMPQVIVQLLTDKEKVLEETVVNKSGRISFDYLLPAKYKLKVILDPNRNRRWDSGDYFRKIQPETVIYFPRTLELRANWDVEESWQL